MTALTGAACATVYLTATAAMVVTPGVWIPAPVTMFTSPVPMPVLVAVVLGVALQLGVTLAWARRATLRRRYVGLVAAVQVAVGLGIFLMAPVFRGSGAAPESGGEPMYMMPAWSLWGLMGLALVGLLMISAAFIHGGSSRRAAATVAPAA
jgi:hypothetical protein